MNQRLKPLNQFSRQRFVQKDADDDPNTVSNKHSHRGPGLYRDYGVELGNKLNRSELGIVRHFG